VVPIDDAAAGSGVAKRLRMIVARAVDPERDKRYQNVTSLRKEVQAFLRGGLHLPRKLFRSGEQIIRQGDRGDAAYMIVSGKCRAFLADDATQTLTVMGPGDVFGEMALVLDEPRAASVEAVDTVTVLVLDKHTMLEGLGVDGWTGALVRALALRFRDLELKARNAGLRRTHDGTK
jgi:serine/threonine-protein kinase